MQIDDQYFSFRLLNNNIDTKDAMMSVHGRGLAISKPGLIHRFLMSVSS